MITNRARRGAGFRRQIDQAALEQGKIPERDLPIIQEQRSVAEDEGQVVNGESLRVGHRVLLLGSRWIVDRDHVGGIFSHNL